MKAIIFDLKQPLKVSSEGINKKDLPKDKDFASTLESVNNKVNNRDLPKETLKTDKKNSQGNNEIKENKKTSEDSDSEALESIEETEEKDYELLYQNMLVLINNTIEPSEELKSDMESIIDKCHKVQSKTSENDLDKLLEVPDEMVMEQEVSSIKAENPKQLLSTKEENFIIPDEPDFEAKDKNITSSKDKEINVQMNTLMSHGEEIQNAESNNEDLLMLNETKLSDSINQFNDNKEFNNSGEKNNSKSSYFGQELDTALADEADKDIKFNSESFIPLDKNGIRFIKENNVELEELETINRKEVIQQIVDKVQVDLSKDKNEIRVKLKPEVLGEMTMDIEVAKGSIIAKILVDNQRTKEIIEGNLVQLKEGLKDTGLEIKTFEVFVGNNSDFDKHNSNQFNMNQNNKRLKIKAQNNKKVTSYEEQSVESINNTRESYLENSLNLLA